MIKSWIILYHHRHGNDAWLYFSENKPDLDKIAKSLQNFEEDQDEYLESIPAGIFFENYADLNNHTNQDHGFVEVDDNKPDNDMKQKLNFCVGDEVLVGKRINEVGLSFIAHITDIRDDCNPVIYVVEDDESNFWEVEAKNIINNT